MTDLSESPRLILDGLETQLRRRSDRRVRTALEVAVLRMGDYTDREIRARLGLATREYDAIIAELQDTLRET